MKIGDLSSGVGQLREATEKLQHAWFRTQEHWKDASSRNLEENHLQPLAGELASAMAAIQHLGDVLSHMRRDCEPW